MHTIASRFEAYRHNTEIILVCVAKQVQYEHRHDGYVGVPRWCDTLHVVTVNRWCDTHVVTAAAMKVSPHTSQHQKNTLVK